VKVWCPALAVSIHFGALQPLSKQTHLDLTRVPRVYVVPDRGRVIATQGV
jgi:hypothetical protein